MTSPFLQIWNTHANSAGQPPTITNEERRTYASYFENRHGNQWAFTYDRQKKSGELRGGDCHWDTVLIVRDGKVEMTRKTDEAMWLTLCWNAATFKPPLPQS
jgi:hypothetical protein